MSDEKDILGMLEAILKKQENDETKEQVGSLIDEQPDFAAGVLRNWLYDDDSDE